MKFGVKRKFPPEKFADRTIKTKAIPTHDNIHPSCSHLNNLYLKVVTSPTYYRWYSLFVSLEFGDLFPESLHEVVMPRDERGHDHELVPRVVLADGQDGAHLVLDRGRQLQLQAPCPLHIKIYIIIEFIIKYIYIYKYNKSDTQVVLICIRTYLHHGKNVHVILTGFNENYNFIFSHTQKVNNGKHSK